MISIRSASQEGNPVSSSATRAGTNGRRVLLVSALLVTLSTGCTGWREYFSNGFKVGPNYCRPAAPVADDWIDAREPGLNDGQVHDVAWWQTFRDPVLDSLIDSAYQQNLSLREAGLRILAARAERGMVVGNLFPQSQQAFGEYSRNQISQHGLSGEFTPHSEFSEWTLGTTLAWELDFWGRFRRAIERQDANLDASVENYDNMLVLLLADVAQSYTNVRIAEQRLAYARENLKSQQGSLDIAKARFREGKVTKLDVTDGQSNVAQTEASIWPLESSRRRAANHLCILMGIPPQSLDDRLAGHQGIPSAPPQVAVGIPAELLRRRPDIRWAEREVAKQSANIGVATADLYPHFTINGTIYLDALRFKDLLNLDSIAGSVGPAFRWDILNYGRLANNVRYQESVFHIKAVEYQKAVLEANEEAENAIVSFLNAQQQVKSLQESVAAAEESYALVKLQYSNGKVDFNRVFIVQVFLTQQQDQLAVAQGAVAQSLIQLYRALGGGWQIRLSQFYSLPPAAPARPAAPVPAPDPPPVPPVPPAVVRPL